MINIFWESDGFLTKGEKKMAHKENGKEGRKTESRKKPDDV
jgi:hypothetical protein